MGFNEEKYKRSFPIVAAFADNQLEHILHAHNRKSGLKKTDPMPDSDVNVHSMQCVNYAVIRYSIIRTYKTLIRVRTKAVSLLLTVNVPTAVL